MPKFRTSIVLLFLLALTLTGLNTTPNAYAQPSLYPNLEAIVLIDESASMYDLPNRPPATDPEDWRTEALELFLNTLSVNMTPAQIKVAVMPFSSSHQTEILLDAFIDPTDSNAVEELLEAYYQQHQRPVARIDGWTDVLDALTKTHAFLQREHDENYKPFIILLSDGRPETIDAAPAESPNRNPGAEDRWDAYINEIRLLANGFNEFLYQGTICRNDNEGAPIYSIAIRKGEDAINRYENSEDREIWLDIAARTNGNYDEILETTDAAFQQKLATIFFEPLRNQACVQVTDRDDPELVPVTGQSELSLTIDSAQEQIIFNVIKSNASIEVTLLDSSGNVVSPNDANVRNAKTSSQRSETWAILRPTEGEWSGQWKLQFEGQGTVVVSYVSFSSLRLNIVIPPEGIIAFGPNWEIRAYVVDAEGNPISEAMIIEKSIVVILPDGTSLPVSDADITISDGVLTAYIPEGNITFFAEPGIYRIIINISTTIGEMSIPFEQVRQFTLSENVPWLDIEKETYQPGEIIRLEGSLKRSTENADATDGEYNIRMDLWHIENGTAEPIGQYTLNHEEGTLGTFTTEDLGVDLPVGDYRLDVYLSYTPFRGQTYFPPPTVARFEITDESMVSVPTEAPPTPTVQPLPDEPTAIPPSPTPVATEEPVSLEQFFSSIPSWVFLGVIGIVLAGVLLVFLLGVMDRPSLAGIEIVDRSRTGYNDRVLDRWDPRSYNGRTLPIRDKSGKVLAKIWLTPNTNGPSAQVIEIAQDYQLRYNQIEQETQDIFYPDNSGKLTVGDVEIGFRGITRNTTT